MNSLAMMNTGGLKNRVLASLYKLTITQFISFGFYAMPFALYAITYNIRSGVGWVTIPKTMNKGLGVIWYFGIVWCLVFANGVRFYLSNWAVEENQFFLDLKRGWVISLNDIQDWTSLFSKLTAEKDTPSPSRRIWQLLPDGVRDGILQGINKNDVDGAKLTFVAALNNVLRRRDFYLPEDFAAVSVADEHVKLAPRCQTDLPDKDVMRLNFCLFEAAYPQEVKWRFKDEAPSGGWITWEWWLRIASLVCVYLIPLSLENKGLRIELALLGSFLFLYLWDCVVAAQLGKVTQLPTFWHVMEEGFKKKKLDEFSERVVFWRVTELIGLIASVLYIVIELLSPISVDAFTYVLAIINFYFLVLFAIEFVINMKGEYPQLLAWSVLLGGVLFLLRRVVTGQPGNP